jgi:two-component system, chemotaxis family, chemotaxis protein CheV
MSLQQVNTEIASSGSILDAVDERTNLAGSNKMEILLFSIGSNEIFGINVFKVKEVTRAVSITKTPNMPHGVDGIASLRGHVMPVLNLSSFMRLGNPAEQKVMMVSEYSRHVLGFLVKDVDRIIRVDWDKVHAAEGMSSNPNNLITAITELPNGTLVSILDVEQILSTAFGDDVVGKIEKVEKGHEKCVFFVDDSAVARKKIIEVLEKMGVKNIQAHNGMEAWQRLKGLADSAQHARVDLHTQLQAILVDAEMPEMDGYVLTQNIKADRRFDHIPVVMHSSLSSEANRAMGKRVGVDYYVAKFDSNMLSDTLRPLLT